MANPKAIIRAGLDAHERAKAGPTTPKLAALAGITGDPVSIQTICARVKTARERFAHLQAAEVEAAKISAADIKAGWRDRGVSIDENGIRSDSFTGTERRKLVAFDIKAAHMERKAATEDERAKLTTLLREAKTSLDLIRDLWSSQVAVLMRVTVGSEKRATYTANLAAAGPTEVDIAASVSARAGDKDLAAAACVRIDGLDKEARKSLKHSKADIAEEVVAVEYRAATEALGMADYYRESGDLMARELEGLPTNPNHKIRVGQKLRELETMLGRPLEGDGAGAGIGDGTTQRDGESFDDFLDRKYPGGPLPPGYTLVG